MNDPEVLSLTPRIEWSRREFVVATLASGFALAAQPVSAQTITTDSKGLTAGEVRIPVKGGSLPAYRAMPETGSGFRWCWSCRKFSAYTSISRTSAAASESLGLWQSRPNSMRARALYRS